MTLGDIIKRYRNDHALSMDAFSERSGISKAYISLLEKNRHPKQEKRYPHPFNVFGKLPKV